MYFTFYFFYFSFFYLYSPLGLPRAGGGMSQPGFSGRRDAAPFPLFQLFPSASRQPYSERLTRGGVRGGPRLLPPSPWSSIQTAGPLKGTSQPGRQSRFGSPIRPVAARCILLPRPVGDGALQVGWLTFAKCRSHRGALPQHVAAGDLLAMIVQRPPRHRTAVSPRQPRPGAPPHGGHRQPEPEARA